MIGMLITWIGGVILFFTLLALSMRLVRAYSQKHPKDTQNQDDTMTETSKEEQKTIKDEI